MDAAETIRTRFAPSPTGFLHVGNLRAALYAFLFAKKHGGVFAVRIEDTDQERFVEGGTENILRSLAWAGIAVDEGAILDRNGGVGERGAYGPYIQSKRLPIYKEHVDTLLGAGNAYRCFCSKERLDELRKTQERLKQPMRYDGRCRGLFSEEADARALRGEPNVVRMKMPETGETILEDLVRGRVAFKNDLVDDQVLLKTDGFPTYHLAVVVDDHAMRMTHVIRGEDWLPSTPKHLVLYRMFGWEPPRFAHLPLLLNADKSKLSKRQGDVSVEDYKEKGYLPEALVNFVAFLGWNPGGNREIYAMPELIEAFDLSRVGRSGAVFNLEKLDWYNEQYIRSMDIGELTRRCLPFLANAGLVKETDAHGDNIQWLKQVVALEKDRMKKLSDLPMAVGYLFAGALEYDANLLVWKKSSREGACAALKGVANELEGVDEAHWTSEAIETAILSWTETNKYGKGDVLWPLRVALSGQKNSPGPFEIAHVLGRRMTLLRVEEAIRRLENMCGT